MTKKIKFKDLSGWLKFAIGVVYFCVGIYLISVLYVVIKNI